ncbi:metallophosphoesterase family protein [Clostridium felsineum]|uniref:metallophosphoesterase family protein n=1 Tax=Clostridium felsineum TaxID=36839 RepID=UPI00098C757C|nr:metallophosphoesterase [Clostridium felsineum]URZ04384.1 3',5'-cyclic adenosine monophosphate phosphodiesterase CpdA [Clostridium felsineum]
MNKIKFLFLFIIALIITTILVSTPESTSKVSANHILQYSFSVISDTHIGVDESKNSSKIAKNKLAIALKCIEKNFPKDKCIVINGDVVDNYYESSYNELTNTILSVNYSKKLPYIYFNLGNHEFKYNGEGPSISECYNENLNRFINKTQNIQSKLTANKDISHTFRSTNKPYDLQYVGNTPFFFLGSDSVVKGKTNDCAYLKFNDQLKSLNDSIGTGLSFIFCHQPPLNTVKGSNASNCISNTDELLEVLKKHPNAIMFTAHTHRTFDNSPLTFGNNYSKLGSCPVITSPSVFRSLEGIHVNVYEDMISVEGVKYHSDYHCTTKPDWCITFR